MLKKISIALIVIIIMVLQTTFFQWIGINGISPNICIATIVSLSALRGRNEGIIYGIAFGFLQDQFYGSVLGFYVIIYTLIAYVAGSLYRNYYVENVVIPLIAVALGDFVYNVYIYFFTYLFRGRLDLPYYLIHLILPEVTYTVIIGIILYKIYVYYAQWLHNYESGRNSEEDSNEEIL